MFTEYKVQLLNDHLLINDGQGVIVDTGSPTSFHDSGSLLICGNHYDVPKSIMSVNSDYLSSEIGGEIHGLLGMDIIREHPILFDLGLNHIYMDDDALYNSRFNSFVLPYNLVCIELVVNNKCARLIVDSGAKISYIDSSFVEERHTVVTKQDFSPLFGHFSTNVYDCIVQFLDERDITLQFGTPPASLAHFLSTLQVQGILGIDFFKAFRLQLRDNCLFFPPQGI